MPIQCKLLFSFCCPPVGQLFSSRWFLLLLLINPSKNFPFNFLFQADSLAAACSLHVDSVPPTGRSPHFSSSPIVFHIILRIDFLLLHNFSFCRRIVSRLRFFTSVTLLTFISQVPLQIPFDKAWHPGKNSNPPKFPRALTHYLSSPPPQTKELRSLNVSRAADTSKLVSCQFCHQDQSCLGNQHNARWRHP